MEHAKRYIKNKKNSGPKINSLCSTPSDLIFYNLPERALHIFIIYLRPWSVPLLKKCWPFGLCRCVCDPSQSCN